VLPCRSYRGALRVAIELTPATGPGRVREHVKACAVRYERFCSGNCTSSRSSDVVHARYPRPLRALADDNLKSASTLLVRLGDV